MTDRRFSIGVFDSGFGGLSILKEIKKVLPNYDYLYLGDNARAPYGNRSFDTVYQYTLQAVERLFSMDCFLIIIACNTASAKALRSIQQINLPQIAPDRRVLGIIRPSVEVLCDYSQSNHIGILGTNGTIKSESYLIEIAKLHPQISVSQEACPLWASLVENNEHESLGADYFVKKHIDALLLKDTLIDTVVLACTHYPLLLPKIKQYMPTGVTIMNQGEIVTKSLVDYLSRHPEIESKCSKNGTVQYFTTDDPQQFDYMGGIFMDEIVTSKKIKLQ